MRKAPGRGFTLVELTVVMFILAMLAAMLLPAIQEMRENGRRASCQNNMHQIGLAVLSYNQESLAFPPSSTWYPGVSVDNPGNMLLESWIIKILPYLGQRPLYDFYTANRWVPSGNPNVQIPVPFTNPIFENFRKTWIPSLTCPSDTYSVRRESNLFMGSSNSQTRMLGDNWARCNYAANASLGFLLPGTYTYQDSPCNLPNAAFSFSAWQDKRLRGVMGANTSIAINSVELPDGVSNTVMLGEIRAGITQYDCRGIWAMAGGSTNSLWGHGYCGNDYGPNYSMSSGGDAIMGCNDIKNSQGGAQALAGMGMPCVPGTNSKQTARSMHRGGVYTCFCDGSVHWISDSIDSNPVYTLTPSIWDRLMLSADGFPVAPDAF
jgi:prepilin-type N-terminal cleavage/methylation domain-containing protein